MQESRLAFRPTNGSRRRFLLGVSAQVIEFSSMPETFASFGYKRRLREIEKLYPRQNLGTGFGNQHGILKMRA